MSEIKVNKVSSRTGNAVTLGTSGDTFTIPAGVTLTNSGTATGFGSDSDISWQAIVSSNTTMEAGKGYFVDSSGGTKTMTLPASPSLGDAVAVVSLDGSTNAVTIARNSSNIEGFTNDLLLDTSYNSVTLVYTDSSNGWVRQTKIGAELYITATGGTESTSGNFKIHRFNSSGNFTVSSIGNASGGGDEVSYMVVAGGGGGGANRGGGAGAGGFREGRASNDSYTASPLNAPSGITVSAQTYPITVGAGGSGQSAPNTSSSGAKGSNSVFATITSAGGGGGRDDDSPAPANPDTNGGSGGGGGGGSAPQNVGGSGNTPPVSPPQGNNGGSATIADNLGNSGGGGGGAGAAGTDNSGGAPKSTGGVGVTSTIIGSPITRSGGGGAGAVSSKGAADGGSGGGATGGSYSGGDGDAGGSNTGGGGGGGAGGGGDGGTGGSGVVVIRYKYQG